MQDGEFSRSGERENRLTKVASMRGEAIDEKGIVLFVFYLFDWIEL